MAMGDGAQQMLRSLEGVVGARHLETLRDIFDGKIEASQTIEALSTLAAKMTGSAPPSKSEEMALVREWSVATPTLLRRYWLHRG